MVNDIRSIMAYDKHAELVDVIEIQFDDQGYFRQDGSFREPLRFHVERLIKAGYSIIVHPCKAVDSPIKGVGRKEIVITNEQRPPN